jgi:hypothetical protein
MISGYLPWCRGVTAIVLVEAAGATVLVEAAGTMVLVEAAGATAGLYIQHTHSELHDGTI